MKYHQPLITVLFILLIRLANAQAPTITGNVTLSVKKGTIDCEFTLKDMPPINTSYVIRINSGMNIHYFKNVKANNALIYYDTDSKDSTSSGETIAYFLPGNKNQGRFLPPELKMHYTGMYPIADSVHGYTAFDWRGNVAFNGYSVRADGLQSGWYPILYDTKKQQMYEKVKYDINITCEDCTTLFVNGSAPVKGTTGHFVSTTPQSMLMYCGNYELGNINNTYLLNPDMGKAQQQEFGKLINSYKAYYEKLLGIPYQTEVSFIQTTPTADANHAFLFVSYPTIINIGVGKYGLHNMTDNRTYFGHELGHYYFGELLRTNTAFGAIVDESFAEYLTLKATRQLFKDSTYLKAINKKILRLKDYAPTPIAAVKTQADIKNRELYVYYFVPMVLVAMEKELGEKPMVTWLKTMLNTKTDYTDYDFFIKTFDASIDHTKAEAMKAKYITSPDALKNALDEIAKK